MIIVVDLLRHGAPTGDCVKRNYIHGDVFDRDRYAIAIGNAVIDAILSSEKTHAVASYRVRFLDGEEISND